MNMMKNYFIKSKIKTQYFIKICLFCNEHVVCIKLSSNYI